MQDSARDRVAANVRAEMARLGYTQRDAATVLDMAQPNVSLRLRGERAFRAEEIAALATWLGVSTEVLLAGASEGVAA